MSRLLKWLYLAVVFAIVAILQVGISRTGRVPGSADREEGYTSLATKIKQAEEGMKKAEAQLAAVTIDPEYDRMVTIPAGSFQLGDRDGGAIEQPERAVFLSSYRIDVYETTFAHYYAFMAATGHRKPRLAGYLGVESRDLPLLMNPFNPAVGVSWDDAMAYCVWKGKRLPSEAEWERAAKGTGPRSWPWGDEADPRFANFVGAEDGFRYSAPVGAFRQDKSPEGAYDMAGNAMEWTADWFDERYYAVLPARDPPGPPNGQERVIRGASWNDSIQRGQTTTRFKMDPTFRDVTIGFRCAQSITPVRHAEPPPRAAVAPENFLLDTRFGLSYNAAVLSQKYS
ncbi:MAG: SUMF1/EgtB/PvdO family nonheme iron enzyme [Nitrospirae bacterium]|nr:SUMF1/EgtB/PvdO family nonheme iron enzyme [Nitrospirota bacterium]